MNSSARLLFITERFFPDVGGVARSATRTATTIAERLGVETHVLAWSRSLPAGELETHVTEPNEPLGARLVVHRLGLFANLDYTLQHTQTLLEVMHRRHSFQGIWGHYLSPAGFLAVLFGQTHGIHSTVSARGNDVDMLTFPPGDFARLIWTLERADVVSAVSADMARKIRVLANCRQPVQVVCNSVDSDLFRPAPPDPDLRARLGIQPDEAVLGFSGELRHKKGIAPLLAAFVEVRQKRPAVLLVIGEVRIRDQAVLASFAAVHPEARSRLIVTGHVEDAREVARHLQLCDLFLQPSLWDGMPNAVLEAMACERLVLASDAGGIPEVIEHGRNGFIVPRTELHRLSEAINELLSLPQEKRQIFQRAARRHVEQRFSPLTETESLRNVLSTAFKAGTPE